MGAMYAEIANYMFGLIAAEASMDAAGFGYTKHPSGRESYDNFSTMNMVPYLTATQVSHLLNNWNVQIHNWLKYYVMLRLIDRSKRGL